MKIDVAINVIGKPYQTICTIKSLLLHCGQHIDKIYISKEKRAFWDKNPQLYYNIPNIIEGVFEYTLNDKAFNPNFKENRYRAAYQFGIEESDKKYVLLSHSDILYTGDIVKEYLDNIGDNVGIGGCGGCWCCPAGNFKKCSAETQFDYHPTYEEVAELIKNYKVCRTSIEKIDKEHPMPLIECKLNDTCAMVDKEIMIRECVPNGTSPLQGHQSPQGTETGHGYFRSMVLKGYKFKHYYNAKIVKHGYWAGTAGWPTFLDNEKYIKAEETAKKYYELNFKADE